MSKTPEVIFALVPYDDGSSPRLKVAEGASLQEGDATLEVHGVGGHVLVHAADIDTLIGALKAAKQHLALTQVGF